MGREGDGTRGKGSRRKGGEGNEKREGGKGKEFGIHNF